MRAVTAMLVGRDHELQLIDQLLDRARVGSGGVLTFSGEPGSGKTRLLDAAQARAREHLVLRCSGVEAEAELPFSALHELLIPHVGAFTAMPTPQRAALEAALGLGPAGAPRLLNVHAGAVTVLSELARVQPLLVLLDDLHWVDSASLAALAFLARRCGHEPIAVVAATRPEAARALSAGDVEQLGPLDASATRSLVEDLLGRPALDEAVAEIVASTGGNPLAISQAVALLGRRTLTRGSGIDEPLPVGDLLDRGFLEMLEDLSAAGREGVEFVAASLSRDASLVWAAVRAAGRDDVALQEPLDRGVLTQDDGRIEFSHPVLRSLVYRTAPPERWRSCHAALAEVVASPTLRAWHRAAATVGPDEVVAHALEEAAAEFAQRGGTLAAAQALARAGELTSDPDRGAERLLRAGRAAFFANRTEWGKELLDAGYARAVSTSLRLRGRYELLIHVSLWGDPGSVTAPYLALGEEARQCGDYRLALQCGAMSLNDCTVRGDGRAALQVIDWVDHSFIDAELDDAAAQRLRAQQAESALLYSGRVRRGGASAQALVDAAHETIAKLHGDASLHDDGLDFGWLLEPLTQLEEFDMADELVNAALQASVDQAAPHALETALVLGAALDVRTGGWDRAIDRLDEADRVGEIGGVPATNATGLAWRAYLEGCRDGADVSAALAVAREAGHDSAFPIITEYAGAAEGAALLSAGRPQEALAVLETVRAWKQLAGQREPCVPSWPSDLVDAALASGDRKRAEVLLVDLRAFADGSRRAWALGAVAWFEGELASPTTFDAAFRRALVSLSDARAPFEEARARLAYGRRLGRSGRSAEAAGQFGAALALLDRLGAEPWAAKVRAELGAEHPTRGDRDRDALTPQERQVAALVATGASNKEAAGELFVSPKTIEAHLSRIYRKLGVTSRTQLAARWSELAQR